MSERNLIDNQRTSSSGSTLPSDKTQQSPTSPNSGDTQNPSPPSTSPSPSPSPSPSTPPADDNKQYLYIAVDGLTLRNADAPSPKSITPSLHLTHAPTSARASCIASIRIDTTQTSSPSLTPTSTLADVRSHLSTHYPSDHISNITSTSISTSSPSLTSSYHFLIRGVPCTSRQENILTIQHVMPVLWIRFRDETSPATTSGVTTSPPLVTPPTNNTSTLMAPASTVAALTGDVHATNTALQQMRPTGSRIDTQQLLLSEANTRIDSLPSSPPPPPPHERTTLLPRRSSMDHTGGEWKIPPSHTHDTPSSYASMGHTPRPATRDTTASKVRYHFDDNDDDDIDGEDNKHIQDVQRTQSLPISRGSPLRLSNDSRRKQHSSRSTSMLQREKSILAPVGHDLEMEGHDDPDHMSLVEDDIQKPIQIVLIGQIDVEDRARQEKRRAMIQQAREEEHLPPLTPRDTESIILKGMIVTYHDTSILLNKSRETWMNETAVDPVWIAVEEATDAQIAAIGEHFGLHPLTIEDCQSRSIREKLEVFPTYLFLVFHALDAVKEKKAEYEVMRTTPIRIIAFPNLVVSFHKSDLTAISAVRKRAAKLYHNLIDNTAWVIHGILDCITDSLLPVVKSNCDEVNSIDAIIYETEGFSAEQQKELLKRMSIAGRRLGFLRQRLWSKRDILVSLIEKDWQVFLRGVQVPYLRDVYDHLVIMLHELDAGMELLEAIQNTYLAIVSIDVATASQRTNENVKSLTAAATILLPLSLVAGVMGMNVTVPWQTGEPTPGVEDLAPFITICGGMVVVAVVMYIYFKKSKYI